MGRSVCISPLEAPFEDCIAIGVSRTRPRRFCELTKAELAVAEALLAGSTLDEIARARDVSARTVGHQVESAYRKLGISSRYDLVALVSRPALAAGRKGEG